jgi:hypothetical protein
MKLPAYSRALSNLARHFFSWWRVYNRECRRQHVPDLKTNLNYQGAVIGRSTQVISNTMIRWFVHPVFSVQYMILEGNGTIIIGSHNYKLAAMLFHTWPRVTVNYAAPLMSSFIRIPAGPRSEMCRIGLLGSVTPIGERRGWLQVAQNASTIVWYQ